MSAVQTALANSFGKRGSKAAKYIKEPHDIGLKTELEQKYEAMRERQKIIDALNRWKAMCGRVPQGGETTSQL